MKVSPSSLYGPGQLFYYPADPREERELESVFLRTLDTLGELSTVVHSTANTPLQVQFYTVLYCTLLYCTEKALTWTKVPSSY